MREIQFNTNQLVEKGTKKRYIIKINGQHIHKRPCYCCNWLMNRSRQSEVSINRNDDTGCRISNDRTTSYRNQDNSPLAIRNTWKVLDIFKMEGAMWWAVYSDNYFQVNRWAIELLVIILPVIDFSDQKVFGAVLGLIVLTMDVITCYNQSIISKNKLSVEARCYCCNWLMNRSRQSEVSINRNDDTGCRISNDRTTSYRNQDNSPPFLSL